MPNSSTDEWQIQGRIARWNGTYEQIRINERAVIDIGIFVLKVVMTINAGALSAVERPAGIITILLWSPRRRGSGCICLFLATQNHGLDVERFSY